MSLDDLRKIDGLDVEQGLRNCMDDEALYRSILEMYVSQLQENMPELTALLKSEDWLAYGRTCHAIKGASASVGATKVMSLSASLEAAGKEADEVGIRQHHEDFNKLLKLTVDLLNTSL